MRRAFKFRAYPIKEAEIRLLEWLRLCRQLYNCALEERITAYLRHRITVSEYDQAKQLKILKINFPEYKFVGSQVLKDVLRRLDRAYKAFFRRLKNGGEKPGFPKFQNIRDYSSFTFPNSSGWRFDGGKYFDIAHVGRLKLRGGKPVTGTICTVTVSRSKTNKWYVIFSCKDVPTHPLPSNEHKKIVALSEGITHLWTDSDNHFEENPRWFEQSVKKLRRLHRALSRKKKGSKRQEQARLALAKEYENLANRRDDFLNKRAHDYARDYDAIGLRKLDIRGLIQSESPISLAGKIHDASWRALRFKVASQCEDHGKDFHEIPAPYTVMECSQCGEMQEMPLHVRVYRCPKCGLKLPRTLNSALNMRGRMEALYLQPTIPDEDVETILDDYSVERSIKTARNKHNY